MQILIVIFKTLNPNVSKITDSHIFGKSLRKSIKKKLTFDPHFDQK